MMGQIIRAPRETLWTSEYRETSVEEGWVGVAVAVAIVEGVLNWGEREMYVLRIGCESVVGEFKTSFEYIQAREARNGRISAFFIEKLVY